MEILLFLTVAIIGILLSRMISKLYNDWIYKMWVPLVIGKFPKNSEETLLFFTDDNEMHSGIYNFNADNMKPWKDSRTNLGFSSNQVIRWCKKENLTEKDLLLLENISIFYNQFSLFFVLFFATIEMLIAYKFFL